MQTVPPLKVREREAPRLEEMTTLVGTQRKGIQGKQPPAKQVRKSNLTGVPEGYYGGMCPKCTVIVPNHMAEGCKARAVARNWGLLLLQTYAPECFREVQDAVCEFLNALTSTTICTVCGKPCSLSHNPLKCVKELEVYVQDGTLKWRLGKRGQKVNTCVRTDDRHQHDDYEEARQCYLKCKEAQAARKKEIQNLLNDGGNPCPRCGDVFADHTIARCVKYSYLVAGDDGFQNALNDGAYIALERLEGLHERLTVGVPEGTPCVSCAGNEVPHDYRGCLKRLKCKKGEDGEWVSEPPGRPSPVTLREISDSVYGVRFTSPRPPGGELQGEANRELWVTLHAREGTARDNCRGQETKMEIPEWGAGSERTMCIL